MPDTRKPRPGRPARRAPPLRYERVYRAVRRIPEGRVATYGQIARLIGAPKRARQIGYALAALRDAEPVPWHRVVNARGEISRRADPGYEQYQRILLEGEGVEFDLNGRIDLSQYQWRPGAADAAACRRSNRAVTGK